MSSRRLGIGFIGSGFMTRFHLQSFVAVRDADVLGVWSPTRENAESAAALARELGIGACRAHDSLESLVQAPEIDALWIVGPNHTRLEHTQEIVSLLAAGKGELVGLACEKPLARNAAEAAEMVRLVESTDVQHGYLENQVFAPSVVRGREIVWRRGAAIAGRPYLARTAEEHCGPHNPWFWDGKRQGGGVLNDMLCHSVEAGRFLLTEPGQARDSLRLRKVQAQIACLKWARPNYAKQLSESMAGIDYTRQPAEDFARATLTYEDMAGHELVLEATTSWSFVGSGLRLSFELLGPEYALAINSLDTDLKVFFSRNVQGHEGEDLVEKQNAEQGLSPVLSSEPAYYGYEAENRHMVQRFLDKRQPDLTWDDGLDVVRILMTCYQAAEEERALEFPPPGIETFVPAVARGTWRSA